MLLLVKPDPTHSTQNLPAPRPTLTRYLGAIGFVSLAALAACGSGGGGGDALPAAPVPPPPTLPASTTDPKVIAGFWSTRVDAQTTASSVFLPEGQAWTVLQATAGTGANTMTTATLVRGAVSVANSDVIVAGPSYTFGSPLVVGSYRLNGTFVPKSVINVPAQAGLPAYSWAYNAAFEVPAKLTDTAGRWNASFSGGAIKVTLDISVLGALTGTSTTGCSYTGSVVPHPANIAVFNLTLDEACLNQAVNSYSGITTVNTAATSLSAAFVSRDGALAGLLVGTR